MPRPPTPKRVNDTAVSDARPSRKIDVHFIIVEDLWRRFRAKLPDLGCSTAAQYLRQCVKDAVEDRDFGSRSQFREEIDDLKAEVKELREEVERLRGETTGAGTSVLPTTQERLQNER